MNLVADNLALMRGGTTVVQQVSATLQPGRITAICGPNGAGKTSLLMGLAGLLKPVVGSVKLDDADLSSMAPRARARALGYLPQSADIAWDVSVESLVALGRLPHRDRGEEQVEAAIAALALEQLRHRPASRLSGGERARALLARVLAGTPQWILADEPLAALDLAHQMTLIAHLKACAASGQGVAIVLHDLALAMNHADRVLVLRSCDNGGRLVADGAPEQALSAETIANGWGVEAEWVARDGKRALLIASE
ncbi:MAG: ABC transporter ATP-binding protein [Erythrobacter sp.]|nr:ABC transporter ATP-binding protein [Erythrobacter sp.]